MKLQGHISGIDQWTADGNVRYQGVFFHLSFSSENSKPQVGISVKHYIPMSKMFSSNKH